MSLITCSETLGENCQLFDVGTKNEYIQTFFTKRRWNKSFLVAEERDKRCMNVKLKEIKKETFKQTCFFLDIQDSYI